eukprot:COSAG02_NODE_9736_length_2127_cov_1.157791_1_plen_67_part_00
MTSAMTKFKVGGAEGGAGEDEDGAESRDTSRGDQSARNVGLEACVNGDLGIRQCICAAHTVRWATS